LQDFSARCDWDDDGMMLLCSSAPAKFNNLRYQNYLPPQLEVIWCSKLEYRLSSWS
jgi:hypothetical protein